VIEQGQFAIGKSDVGLIWCHWWHKDGKGRLIQIVCQFCYGERAGSVFTMVWIFEI
jgi:hypothetical protein